MIQFVRNLIEYSGKHESSETGRIHYSVLTDLLHSKENTQQITFGQLKTIFKEYIDKDDFDATIQDTDFVYPTIMSVANVVVENEFNLENKLVLAIAIRHKAEEYMWSVVTDKSPFSGSQTGKLFGRYRTEFAADPNHKVNIRTLESVNIMTPENIHINSFMYEPILDMGMVELKRLYSEVSALV